MENEKKFVIDSFEKLLNVINGENIDRLSIDFLNWLNVYQQYVAELRKKYPKQTKGKLNWDICKSSFNWIDDGKNEIKFIEHHNQKTGEVTFFDLKKKK